MAVSKRQKARLTCQCGVPYTLNTIADLPPRCINQRCRSMLTMSFGELKEYQRCLRALIEALEKWARLPTSNGNCEEAIQQGQIPLQPRYCRDPYPCHRILAGLTRLAGQLLGSIVLECFANEQPARIGALLATLSVDPSRSQTSPAFRPVINAKGAYRGSETPFIVFPLNASFVA